MKYRNPETGEVIEWTGTEWKSVKPPADKPPMTTMNKIAQGAVDPIYGGSSLLYNMLPLEVQKAGNEINKWLISIGVPLDEVPPGGVDQMVDEREEAYQAARGESGFDPARLAGNIVSPANIALLKLAKALRPATTLGGRMAEGAALGGASAALMPVTNEGDYTEEKLKQVATGAGAGAFVPAAAGGIARIVRPKTSEAARTLLAEGVTPTQGQILGGVFKRSEEGLNSLPVIGDAIKMGQRRGIFDFNRATYARALKKIGEKPPKDVPVGYDGVAYVQDRLSSAYKEVHAKMTGVLDTGLKHEIAKIKSMARSGLKPRYADDLVQTLDDEVVNRFTPGGKIAGETIQEIQSKLKDLSAKYGQGMDAHQRKVGLALAETSKAVDRMLIRHNPKDTANRLKAVNAAWADFKIIQRAAQVTGAKEGVFTPAQFGNAVRVKDISKDKSASARGQARLQDLSEAGQSVLSQTVPDSGTPFRIMASTGTLGGAAYFTDPTQALLMGAAAAAPYTPIGQKIMAGLLSQRPAGADVAAEAIRSMSPLLAPSVAPIGLLGQ